MYVSFLIIVTVCLPLLFDKLRTVLVPFIWAVFFAMPFECAVQFLSRVEVG